MRKTTLFVLSMVLFLFCAKDSIAQSSGFYSEPYKSRNSGSFDQSKSILSLGYGFPNLSGTGYSWFGKRMNIGPAYLKFEKGIRDEVGVGGYVVFAASRYKYSKGAVSRATALGAAVLGYYHFNKFIPIERLDVYGGLGIGFRTQHYNNTFSDYTNTDTDVFPVVKVGARWYFSDIFSVYAESGYDHMSSINLGVSLSF